VDYEFTACKAASDLGDFVTQKLKDASMVGRIITGPRLKVEAKLRRAIAKGTNSFLDRPALAFFCTMLAPPVQKNDILDLVHKRGIGVEKQRQSGPGDGFSVYEARISCIAIALIGVILDGHP
jgi:hypothetical protein